MCSSSPGARCRRGALPVVGPRSCPGCLLRCAASAVCGMRAGRASPAHYAKAPVRIRARAGGPPVAVPAPGFVRPWRLCAALLALWCPPGCRSPSRACRGSPVGFWGLLGALWCCWCVRRARVPPPGPLRAPPPPGWGSRLSGGWWPCGGGPLVVSCFGPPRGPCPSAWVAFPGRVGAGALGDARGPAGRAATMEGAHLPAGPLHGLD